MKPFETRVTVVLAVAVLAGTWATTIGASLRSSSAKLTVVPPAYYSGSSSADTLVGTDANDVLIGRDGNDTLYGRRGNDVLQGGGGNDRLFGGVGRDSLVGGPGNDRLSARDGERDAVNGGLGFDEAWIDRLDVVRNVERVHRP